MDKQLPQCSFGSATKLCHKNTYISKYAVPELKNISSYSPDEQRILKLRFENPTGEMKTICLHHEQIYLVRYTHLKAGKLCTNPFGNHDETKRQGTRIITIDMIDNHPSAGLIPGQKLCAVCGNEASKPSPVIESFESDVSSNTENSQTTSTDAEVVVPEETSLNVTLKSMGETPVKHNLPYERRPSHGIQKMQKAVKKMSTQYSKEQGVRMPELTVSTKADNVNKPSTSGQTELEKYLKVLKKKYNDTNSKEEKFQILTLAPPQWSIHKVHKFFGASERQVRKARSTCETTGILSKPEKKKGRPLKDEIKLKVLSFYEDDNVSRQCAGAKEAVSIVHGKEKKQKRLILMNLKEAFSMFKSQEPNATIGFSSFASLRPKWCVLPGASGTHAVCVCTYHQNFKLMLSALGISLDYKEILSKTVCSLESEPCMMGQCSSCPNSRDLTTYLDSIEHLEDLDTIEYNQWVTVDRSTLETLVDGIDVLKSKVTDAALELRIHHYTAKRQNQYLKELKEQLQEHECILILDFAENYHFVIQDAAQGFHWDNSQSTVHPFVLYYRRDGNLTVKSYAVISDDLCHLTSTVYCFQERIIQEVKKELGTVLRKIHYFSDGSPTQYKNKKNFLNVCFHQQDFQVDMEWNFFATAHGKNSCDGVGGVVKREAARASLQKIANNHIQTPKQLFQWAAANLKGITILWVPHEEIEDKKERVLNERFLNARAIPGCRSSHKFVPISECEVQMFQLSCSTTSTTHSTGLIDHVDKNDTVKDINEDDFVAFLYDGEEFVGQVIKINSEDDFPVHISAMEKCGTNYYRWPRKSDELSYKWEDIIQKLSHPEPIGHGTRGAFVFKDYSKKS